MAGAERSRGLSVLYERKNRAFFVAVAGSLLLHVALLVCLGTPREIQWQRPKAGDPLRGRVVETSQRSFTTESDRTPEQKESASAPVRPKPAPAKSQREPKRTPAASIALEQAGPEKDISPAPQPAQSASSDVPDAGSLAQYRIALMGAAKRYKGYPGVALENRWQGKVEVRMAIGIDGSIASLEIRSSAGHAVLDQHALAMIEQAKDMAHIPPVLRGKPFTVEIPVVFTLQSPES